MPLFPDDAPNPQFERSLPLMRRYPELFGPGPWPLEESMMFYGFSHGDGWLPLVEALLEDLSQIARREGAPIRITQVDQKMGRLNVHLSPKIEPAAQAVREAVEASGHICEDCGAPSKVRHRDGRRFTTRCDPCEGHRRERLAQEPRWDPD